MKNNRTLQEECCFSPDEIKKVLSDAVDSTYLLVDIGRCEIVFTSNDREKAERQLQLLKPQKCFSIYKKEQLC